jgi:hypothetical protein
MWDSWSGSRCFVFAIVNFRAAIVLGGLALAGALLMPLRSHLDGAGLSNWGASKVCPAALPAARLASATIPGGMRALMADGLWLKVYSAWAVHDRVRTEALIRWVTVLDDRPTHFWVNGARIIAYDIPQWRLASASGGRAPPGVRKQVVEEQACAALEYLASARSCHPASAAIWMEMGNINLYRRDDLAAAAECYRRAAETPDAPYCAARIHAELLRRLGRDREAYVWLCRIHPTLPREDESAMSGLVLARIRSLEAKLQVPEMDRYSPVATRSPVRSERPTAIGLFPECGPLASGADDHQTSSKP